MKKWIAWMLAVVCLLSLAACGAQPAEDQNPTESENVAADPNQQKYDEILQFLKDGEYDIAISIIQGMEDDAIKAENANKGIKEIAITSDNWSEYFTIDFDYSYYFNSFDEITHINGSTGFRLKDEYQLVKDDHDRSTSVAFEVEQQPYVADVTYDFKAGTFTLSEEKKPSNGKNQTSTNTYTPSVYHDTRDYPGTGVCGIGYQWQGDVDDGTVQEETVYRIVNVLRAEGTLYIYEK